MVALPALVVPMEVSRFSKSYCFVVVMRVVPLCLNAIWLTSGELASLVSGSPLKSCPSVFGWRVKFTFPWHPACNGWRVKFP